MLVDLFEDSFDKQNRCFDTSTDDSKIDYKLENLKEKPNPAIDSYLEIRSSGFKNPNFESLSLLIVAIFLLDCYID